MRAWAPLGVDRLYSMLQCDFFGGGLEKDNEAGLFRVVPGFVVQFGIAGLPAVSAAWATQVIQDDPVTLSNLRGEYLACTQLWDTTDSLPAHTLYASYLPPQEPLPLRRPAPTREQLR